MIVDHYFSFGRTSVKRLTQLSLFSFALGRIPFRIKSNKNIQIVPDLCLIPLIKKNAPEQNCNKRLRNQLEAKGIKSEAK